MVYNSHQPTLNDIPTIIDPIDINFKLNDEKLCSFNISGKAGKIGNIVL